MIITTTNSIESETISEYLGLVSANIVIGANFFSDFAASITDVFGGQSTSYQNKLDELYAKVIESVKLKAIRRKADAIVGFKIDFDEISGKGKSMFMVTAIGTAVRFKTVAIKESAEAPKPVKLNEVEKIEEVPESSDKEAGNSLDEIEQQVVKYIQNNNISDARYLLMTKKGYSLNTACNRIEELKNM